MAFHAQQAAEKFLKAALVNYAIAFPRTHDISVLLDALSRPKAALAARLRHAQSLTPFGAETRYPGDAPDVSSAEASRAVLAAGKVRHAVHGLLRAILTPPASRRRR